jgi:hypothetical protein
MLRQLSPAADIIVRLVEEITPETGSSNED